MDIIKVFGSNVKAYRQRIGYPKKHLPKNVVCTEHISVQSNVFAEAYH